MVNIGEFELIKKISRELPDKYKGHIGIGDDAAVIEKDLMITTDAMVDGVHFLSDQIDFRQLGYKSMAVNISDIAAMGGHPLYALLTIGISDKINDLQINQYIQGIQDIRREFDFDLIGGDTVKSGTFFISITMAGKPFKKPLTRKGARKNDRIYVSGSLGDSAIGLSFILGNSQYKVQDEKYFIERHYLPKARVNLIEFLCKKYRINSCIDISDGFMADLGHIAESSRLGYNINCDLLPVSSAQIGDSYQTVPMVYLNYALSGGEDYELIFSSPDNIDTEMVLKKTGVPVTFVGTMTEGKYTLNYHGRELNTQNMPSGYRHF